jgi:hypothetical protein
LRACWAPNKHSLPPELGFSVFLAGQLQVFETDFSVSQAKIFELAKTSYRENQI